MVKLSQSVIDLKSISRIYVITAILTLILLVTSFQQIKTIFSDTSRLYQHPYKVSNASLNIQFHIQRIYQITKDISYARSSNQIRSSISLVEKHEKEVVDKLALISQRYLGKKEVIDTINQLITNWGVTRQKIFNIYLKKINKLDSNLLVLAQIEQQSDSQAAKLQSKILDIVKLADYNAKVFSDNSKSNFNIVEKIIFLFFFFLLSMQFLLFKMFKRHSRKEKKEVIKALNWSNQLIDSSPDAMIISDKKGNISQVNTSAEKLFGYNKTEFINLSISELMPKKHINHEDKVEHFFNHHASRAMGEGKDLYAVKKSGEEFQVEISLNLAELNNDKVAITSIRDVTKQKRIESKVLHQANYDFLTQLPNRFLSSDRLAIAIERAKRSQTKLAVMYIDLDDFKKANDVFGHQVGDQILVSAATRLKQVMRAEDTVARFGGDEFFVLINSFSSQDALAKIATKILASLKKPFSVGQINTLLSASVGISIYPDDGNTAEDLMISADISMYRSKNRGKNSYTFFKNSMLDKLKRQSSMEEALKGSLERDEFYVVYQPKYEICSNMIIGFEALVRWDNTEFKDTGPDEFIPILEQMGLINEVGLFVLDDALKSIKQWRSMTKCALQVAVNISPVQFDDPLLFQHIQQSLAKYDLPGHALEIEITEGILLEATTELKNTLNKMRNVDIGIALDDFGTGYSSLSYIKDYPINSIKVDRSFIEEINKNKTHTTLVNAMISLAHSLGFHVTAEGIECQEQLKYLKELKCNIAQGYYLSRPLTADKVIDLL